MSEFPQKCIGKTNLVGSFAAIGASFFVLASDTMFLGAGTAANYAAARAELA
ncbi:hypothetical protein [Mesorhizobium sp. dw_380]|uniref:hypothetical protein n=1 Tax=Mesorhizobium sp. dw_380 TaxID=2812001 RepID=UPI002032BC93|nr:hypothetical protein [Mesorhizobium sp. dw_380]